MSTSRSSAASVKPSSLPVGELLEKRSPFRVPRYQRPYAWDTERVDEFIDDIQTLLDKGQSDHFFGSMVAIQTNDHTQASTQLHEVVDGQQRLTTFCLLIAQIVRHARQLEEEARAVRDEKLKIRLDIFAEETENRYLFYECYNTKEGTKSYEPRLELSKEDDAKFRALLSGHTFTSSRASHKLLQQAYETIGKKLIGSLIGNLDSTRSKFQELQRLRDSILEDTFIIHIVSEDHQSGYRLFSVLNDRGKRLAVADLLRSHTLEQLDRFRVLQEQSARRWDDILTEGSHLADEFLKVYLPSMTGSRLSPERLFDGLKKTLFKGSPASEHEALEVANKIKDLTDEFQNFISIKEGIWPYPDTARHPAVTDWQRARLKRLITVLKHDLSIPLLLAACRCVDEKRFAELVHMLEKFAFRYKNICDGHASAASKHYYATAKNLRVFARTGMQPTWDKLTTELRKLVDERAPAHKFKAQLVEKLRYDHPTQRGNIRELLTTLDDYWSWLQQGGKGSPKHSTGLVVDIDQATIEHIYPQNSASKNKNEDLEKIKHRLGNLSYWDPRDNVTAANRPFTEKRALFANSQSALTRSLSVLPDWNIGQYNIRLQNILEDACKIFTI
ncbi:GmrSD restriction endonuclease domain-containing protein [Sphaerimonospora mesophila]|uniref:DUF262 domain-containing protein n=1 Tax=Sphaerimonospora mesophila TaxID=37483 RepID=UPI001365A226